MKKQKVMRIKTPVEFSCKTTAIEKYLMIGMTVFFALTLIYDKNRPLLIAFYAIACLILGYYFIIFRRRPPYVQIDAKTLTVHNGLLFRPRIIVMSSITHSSYSGGSLVLDVEDESPAVIYSFLLDANDFEYLIKIFGLPVS
ncbi:MAG TPA: hypothetical protein VF857_02325 [Spirochaetota bacterium]